ncbi:hypothetical protein AWN76_001550 [Rhodothermaceae bacterium RA]|nr:hypothetical protein AWN76_001550 [Rhodothermaceae bacterium RA]
MTPLLAFIVFVLAVSLALYLLLGGADFGAGILEGLTRGRDQRRLADAIAPVWEANHVWILLVIVILFVGFPSVYSTLTHYLHLPLLAALLGIVFRGAFFAFRHYDVGVDPAHRFYAWGYRISSVWTPFFLGMTLGAAFLGRIDPAPASFVEGFVAPWLNPFAAAVGLFTVVLCAYVAAVFMVGEVSAPSDQTYYARWGAGLLAAAVPLGGVVFWTAHRAGYPLLSHFLAKPAALAALGVATLLLPLIALSLRRRRVWTSRVLVGLQLLAILGGFFAVEFPTLVRLRDGSELTLLNTQAPPAVLAWLAVALVVGVVVVFPATGYLFWVFKQGPADSDERAG